MAPVVSILVVTADRLVDLRRCLSMLRSHLASAGAPTAEILTTHPPHDHAAMAMVASEFPEVRIHVAPRRHLSEQRNVAARHASGELLVYLDDDAYPHPDWLRQLVAAFADARVLAASGPVFRGDGSLQCTRLAASSIGRLIPLADGAPLPARMAPSFSGCNLAIRRSTLFALGGFDENLCYQPDDMDLCARLFAHAGREPSAFAYQRLAAVTHESSPGPFRRTLQDRAWYVVARDNVYFACRHAGRLRGVLGGVLLQLPKLWRFGWWLLQGRLGPGAFLRCFGKHIAGTVAGAIKGLTQRPRLPLRATDLPSAAAASASGSASLPTTPPSLAPAAMETA